MSHFGLGLTMLTLVFAPGPLDGERISEKDRQNLQRYAADTWRSIEAMTADLGLPADKLLIHPDGTTKTSGSTSPTDIASYLWSTLAAERLGLITADHADRRLDRIITKLGELKREHGFFFNFYDPVTSEPHTLVGKGAAGEHRFLSTVDNGWLAAGLMMVGNARPGLRQRTEDLLRPMDFGFFYEPFDPSDPLKHPGQLRGGFHPHTNKFSAFYGMVNTEPRIASYVAIARGQVPTEHYYRLFRTLPTAAAPQKQTPRGALRTFHDVAVFEGHYDYHGMKIVPSWGGSMFEALMVPLFVPEAKWAPRSWGVNHPLYAQAQIEQGLLVRKYGVWGFSPALNPSGGYRTYGVLDLGTEANGYHTFDNSTKPHPDGVVTPHASFLALAFAPREALDNLRTLTTRFPKIYGPFGFRDSVDVSTGDVAQGVLILDQGMILAAIANALCDDVLQAAFTRGTIETTIRPLIADEQFSAAHRPADMPPPGR